jgi:hypothetical protein
MPPSNPLLEMEAEEKRWREVERQLPAHRPSDTVMSHVKELTDEISGPVSRQKRWQKFVCGRLAARLPILNS